MKSYIFSLILKIFLLAVFVLGIFYILQKNENTVLSLKKENVSAIDVKNILLTLMETYEKKLLGLKSNLEDEKKSLVAELEKANNRTEKIKIQNRIKEIENAQKKTDTDLSVLKNQITDHEAQIKIKNDSVTELKNEKERLQNDIIDSKIYWDNYVNNIKSALLINQTDQSGRDKVAEEFSKDFGKSYITGILKNYSNKDSGFNNTKNTGADDDKNLKNNYETVLKYFEEVSFMLAGNNSDLVKKINDNKNKKDDSDYIKILKEVAIAAANDEKSRSDSDKNSIISKKDQVLKNTQENFDRLRSEKGVLENKVENYIKDKEKLENNISSLQFNLTGKDKEIEILLDLSNINGYFVSRNNSTIMMLNKKKETEIISTGTFNVYDKNKNIVSKVYLSKQGQKIIMTKVPGYNNPTPGSWF